MSTSSTTNAKGSVLVLGSGLVCPPLVHYLSSFGYSLTLASRTLRKATEIVDSLPSASRSYVTAVAYDIDSEPADLPQLHQLVSAHDLTVSLLPYIHHVKAAKVCLQHRKHFFTTSYVSKDMEQLHEQVKAAGLCFMNEAGLYPGQQHSSTAAAQQHSTHTDRRTDRQIHRQTRTYTQCGQKAESKQLLSTWREGCRSSHATAACGVAARADRHGETLAARTELRQSELGRETQRRRRTKLLACQTTTIPVCHTHSHPLTHLSSHSASLSHSPLSAGLDHMSAQRFIDRVHSAGGVITSFHSLCGGLPSPAANTNPLGYKLSWSPRGVLLASRNTATYLKHGEVRSVGGERLYEEGVGYHTESIVDTGAKRVGRLELEWYPNRDSTVYGEIYGIQEAHTLIRGTYRNAGWCAMMRLLSRYGFTETEGGRADKQWRRALGADGELQLAQFTYSVLTDSGDKMPEVLKDEQQMRAWVKQRLGGGSGVGGAVGGGVASAADGQANGHVNGSAGATTTSSTTSATTSTTSSAPTATTSDSSLDNVLDRFQFLGLLSSTTTLPSSTLSRLPCSLDVVCELFERHLQYAVGEEDMVVMKHTFEVAWPSRGRSHREQHTCTLIDTGAVHGVAGQYSSMARTVSQPVAICIRALLDGRWANKPELVGVLRPVQPEVYNTVLDEMEGLGVVFKEERAPLTLWVRSESKAGEHRVALIPQHARRLMEEAAQQVPGGAAGGLQVVVERSPHRCIPDAAYATVGCQLVAENSWKEDAPDSAIVLGLKELPEGDDSPLHHRHVFFAHCYKQQQGWEQVLRRFVASQLGDVQGGANGSGGATGAPSTISTTNSNQVRVVKGVGSGLLWDLEFLVDQQGRRVAAFGRAAGLVGMALGLLQWCCQHSGRQLRTPLQPFSSIQHMIDTVRQELDYVTHLPHSVLEQVRAGGVVAVVSAGGHSSYTVPAGALHDAAVETIPASASASASSLTSASSTTATTTATVTSARTLPLPSVLVLGALGRCGAGCVWVCRQLGLPAIAEWDLEQTRGGGPFPALASDFDVVVNSIYLSPHVTIPPFLTQQLLDEAESGGSRRVSVVVDVSCDTSNPNHPLPFYTQGTTLSIPVLPVTVSGGKAGSASSSSSLPLDVIAIDHLPALIPTESSDDFSAALSPHLAALATLHQQPTHPSEYIWNKAEQLFEEKVKTLPGAAK